MNTLIIDVFDNDYNVSYTAITVIGENGIVPIKEEHKDKINIGVLEDELRPNNAPLYLIAEHIVNVDDFNGNVRKYIDLSKKVRTLRKKLREDASEFNKDKNNLYASAYETDWYKQRKEEVSNEYNKLSSFGKVVHKRIDNAIVWKGIGFRSFCKLYNIGHVLNYGYRFYFHSDISDVNRTDMRFNENAIGVEEFIKYKQED